MYQKLLSYQKSRLFDVIHKKTNRKGGIHFSQDILWTSVWEYIEPTHILGPYWCTSSTYKEYFHIPSTVSITCCYSDPSLMDEIHHVTVCSHARDTEGAMLLDIFDEKLHPLSVRHHQLWYNTFCKNICIILHILLNLPPFNLLVLGHCFF